MSQEKIIKAMELNPKIAEQFQQAMQHDNVPLSLVMNAAVHLYLEYRACGEFSHYTPRPNEYLEKREY